MKFYEKIIGLNTAATPDVYTISFLGSGATAYFDFDRLLKSTTYGFEGGSFTTVGGNFTTTNGNFTSNIGNFTTNSGNFITNSGNFITTTGKFNYLSLTRLNVGFSISGGLTTNKILNITGMVTLGNNNGDLNIYPNTSGARTRTLYVGHPDDSYTDESFYLYPAAKDSLIYASAQNTYTGLTQIPSGIANKEYSLVQTTDGSGNRQTPSWKENISPEIDYTGRLDRINLTLNSAIVTMSSTAGLKAGMSVVAAYAIFNTAGTGYLEAVINSVDSETQLTLSRLADEDTDGVFVVFGSKTAYTKTLPVGTKKIHLKPMHYEANLAGTAMENDGSGPTVTIFSDSSWKNITQHFVFSKNTGTLGANAYTISWIDRTLILTPTGTNKNLTLEIVAE